jgi:hypothetical protein
VEETGVPGEYTDLSQVTAKLYYIMLYQVHLTWVGFKLTTLVVVGTDCISSCIKYNYHTMTTMTTPHKFYEDTSIIICVELLATEPGEQQLLLL